MLSTKTTVAALAAVAGLIQMTPAPQAVVAAIIGGVAGGAVGGGATLCLKYCPGGNSKRFALNAINELAARDLPPGVSQESIDQCTQQINDQQAQGITVVISDVDETTVNVDSVPPACMNLATVLTGNPAQAGGPVPIPMGSASLQYQGLTVEDRQNLSNALGAAASS